MNTTENIQKYTLRVYNHATRSCETVEVTEEVFHAYRRTEWNIEDNMASFYEHEIQFSSLLGGAKEAHQNFREFIDTENTPDKILEREAARTTLLTAIAALPQAEQDLIRAIFFEGCGQKVYAMRCGVTQQTISKRKRRILNKLKKSLHDRL